MPLPKIISIVLIFALISFWSGCASIPEEHKGTTVGAGVGAATGAIAGALIGGSTKATVIGVLAGALVGGVIGHYAYDKRKTREETAKTYNYKASYGTMLTIEEASLSPQNVKSGEVVEIKMTYAVLNPSPGAKSTITEIREITYNGEPVGKPETRVERPDGTYTSTVPLRLPSNAKKGQYRVTTTVQSANVKDTKEISFWVI